jgi:hypothetical protein
LDLSGSLDGRSNLFISNCPRKNKMSSSISFDDASIVPTQQFTRYPDLIKAVIRAVIKVTPQSHLDMGPVQRAFIKYSYIGRTSNERKMIAESQEELRAI